MTMREPKLRALRMDLSEAWTKWGARRLIRRSFVEGIIGLPEGKNLLSEWKERKKLSKQI